MIGNLASRACSVKHASGRGRGLLPLILLVVLRQPGLDLLKVHIFPINQNLAENPLITVILAVIDNDRLPGDQIRQMLFGLGPKRLPTFRSVNPLQVYLCR